MSFAPAEKDSSLPPVPKIGARSGAAIFALALAVRLAATAIVGFSDLSFGDSKAYLFAARTLARTGEYPDRTDPFFFRPPAYPVFLAVGTLGDPGRIALAKVENCLLGAFVPLALTFLSARIFRRRDAALATGVVASLDPSLVLLSREVQSEPLFLVFLLAAGFLLLVAVDRPSSTSALVAGACLALAALTRSTALVLAPLLAAPLLDRRLPPRARRHIAGAALAGFLAALAPWTLRNALRFREFLPVNDAAGVAIYQGNSIWTRRYYDIRSVAEYREWMMGVERDLLERLANLDAAGETSPARRSAGFTKLAIEESLADPRGSVRLMGLKAWQWIRPYPTPWYWPATIVLGVGVLYAVIEGLVVLGIARSARRGIAAFAIVFLAVTMVAHVLLIVVWRYRVPYWHPILLLYAVPGARTLAQALPPLRGF